MRARAGTVLDPAVAELFASDDGSWLDQATVADARGRRARRRAATVAEVDAAWLAEVGAALGDLGDLKTLFTHGHAREVARLGVAACEVLGLDDATRADIELAALLHDVVRIAVSNAVWEKPGPLTSTDWEQVALRSGPAPGPGEQLPG